MKAVEATIPAANVDKVAGLLLRMGAEGVTITEARRFGRADGRRDIHRGSAHELDSIAAVHVEVVIDDALVNSVVAAFLTAARGGGGEGQVLVSSVDKILRIGATKRPGAARPTRRRPIPDAPS